MAFADSQHPIVAEVLRGIKELIQILMHADLTRDARCSIHAVYTSCNYKLWKRITILDNNGRLCLLA